MKLRVAILVVALLLTSATALGQQRDASAFSFFLENDAFISSDTGYTNGVRISWSALRYRGWMRKITQHNVATTFDAALKTIGLGRVRLSRLGLIPNRSPAVHCDENPVRDDRATGPCSMLNVALAQAMYTPDSLASRNIVLNDRPYGGFLYATVGVTLLDSPRARSSGHWLAFTQVSHQLLFGFTGKLSFAENTQSLAHWTFSPASHRPLGWRNQLRTAPQVGLITDIAARPGILEYCKAQCDGTMDELRRVDLTPHTEVVTSTHMLRLSQGLTLRAGIDFPDMVETLRIPVTAPASGARARGLTILGERYWFYGFANAEARYVPYNMFIRGGYKDGGEDGWRTRRMISPRYGVFEHAYGISVGSSRMSVKGQYAYRTPEYDVIGARRAHGWHGYGSVSISILTKARAG